MTASSQRTSSKIRKLIRQHGWTVVKIKATADYPDPFSWSDRKDNTLSYHEMVEWCRQTFAEGTWTSSLFSYTGNSQPGTRRFVFQNPVDAVAFSLRWQ